MRKIIRETTAMAIKVLSRYLYFLI